MHAVIGKQLRRKKLHMQSISTRYLEKTPLSLNTWMQMSDFFKWCHFTLMGVKDTSTQYKLHSTFGSVVIPVTYGCSHIYCFSLILNPINLNQTTCIQILSICNFSRESHKSPLHCKLRFVFWKKSIRARIVWKHMEIKVSLYFKLQIITEPIVNIMVKLPVYPDFNMSVYHTTTLKFCTSGGNHFDR